MRSVADAGCPVAEEFIEHCERLGAGDQVELGVADVPSSHLWQARLALCWHGQSATMLLACWRTSRNSDWSARRWR
jgi:hypothetical protein